MITHNHRYDMRRWHPSLVRDIDKCPFWDAFGMPGTLAGETGGIHHPDPCPWCQLLKFMLEQQRKLDEFLKAFSTTFSEEMRQIRDFLTVRKLACLEHTWEKSHENEHMGLKIMTCRDCGVHDYQPLPGVAGRQPMCVSCFAYLPVQTQCANCEEKEKKEVQEFSL